jgi:hypothetical protein
LNRISASQRVLASYSNCGLENALIHLRNVKDIGYICIEQ